MIIAKILITILFAVGTLTIAIATAGIILELTRGKR